MIRVAACTNPESNRLRSEYFSRDFVIFSCGYQHFVSRNYQISRPEGRQDYQLLYIYKGRGTFLIGGKQQIIKAGGIVLYRPGEPQIYSYRAQDEPEVYWIHFLGTKSGQLLERFPVAGTNVGAQREIKQIFDKMILELQLRKPLFEDACMADFLSLLVCISRFSPECLRSTPNRSRIDQLLAHLNRHYMEPWTIPMMAAYCRLSTDYFSHQFKSTVGVSPMRFLNQLRIDHAKEILLTENLTVAEAAKLVGYDNPLYFSRVFKSSTGIPPKLYSISQL